MQRSVHEQVPCAHHNNRRASNSGVGIHSSSPLPRRRPRSTGPKVAPAFVPLLSSLGRPASHKHGQRATLDAEIGVLEHELREHLAEITSFLAAIDVTHDDEETNTRAVAVADALGWVWPHEAGRAGQMRGTATPGTDIGCLLYTSPSPRDRTRSRMPSSA